jgi:dynein light chain Tctex-type 1
MYDKNKVNEWSKKIIDDCIKGLSKLGKPFKYCVTCVLSQHNGAGLNVCGNYYRRK